MQLLEHYEVLYELCMFSYILVNMMFTFALLGNPGKQYEKTRHNVARIAFNLIAEELARVENAELFIPESFMNESGRDIAEYLRYHEGRELVVVYDDKDIPFGKLRISHDRGDGGHNGVKSVIESLGTREFTRIRIGIAHKETDGKEVVPLHGEQVQHYVMGKITEDEESLLRVLAPNLLQAVKSIASHGYQKAMEECNGK